MPFNIPHWQAFTAVLISFVKISAVRLYLSLINKYGPPGNGDLVTADSAADLTL